MKNIILWEYIREFMQSGLVKMILYGSCARGDYRGCSDVDIALLVKGNRTDSWKYNIKLMKWQQSLH